MSISSPIDASRELLNQAEELHKSGADGLRVSQVLVHRLDTLLRSEFAAIEHPEKKELCVVALGGYGRKELSFRSDVDLMLLVDNQTARTAATPANQAFVHRLFERNLDVGHSFRTIDECLSSLPGDTEIFFSLLESRFICGAREVFDRFRVRLKSVLPSLNRPAFLSDVSGLLASRHDKYGDSAKLLEPNVKNSAGGLRDLHTVLWLLHGIGAYAFPSSLGVHETALTRLLGGRIARSLFTERSLQQTRDALAFLLRTRNEMHRLSGSVHDTLEFTFQIQVAKGLGYVGGPAKAHVERFMTDYYSATRHVAAFTRRLLGWAHDRYATAPASRPMNLDGTFGLRNGRIVLRKRHRGLSNEQILTAFLHAAEQKAEFSFTLEDAIHRQLPSVRPLGTMTESGLLRMLLNRFDGTAPAVQRMNELGLLERWIPEWRPLVSFFQHNQYHYYTADEHTLVVLQKIERLATSQSVFGNVYRILPRKDILYLAALFHDIAKPINLARHESVGVDVAEKILKRLHYIDAFVDAAFLIRNHLVLEQIAFRRNINDPQTISELAKVFVRPDQLDYLFVLTYADLSAVNKNVWTEWKELLLSDLYQKTRQALVTRKTEEEIHSEAAQRTDEARERVVKALSSRFGQEDVDRHVRSIGNPEYLASFTPAEIGDHLKTLGALDGPKALFNHWSDVTEITILAQDAPFVLSKCCGVLSANDGNILDARIFTRDDGIIIDKFRVNDFSTKSSLREEQCRKIADELSEVIGNRMDIDHLLHRHRMKWRRRIKPANPNIRIDVAFEDHPYFTIIDVYGTDMLGFLYKITDALSRLGLNIHFAKIATRVDGIVDAFYVLDKDGKRILEPDRQEEIKASLLTAMKEMAMTELVLA